MSDLEFLIAETCDNVCKNFCRLKKKMSRTELGNKLEVKGYAVYTWEIGRYQPRPMYIGMMREILGISQEELDKCRI